MEIHSEFPCLFRRPSRVNLRNEKRSISDSLGRRGVPKFNYQFSPFPSLCIIYACFVYLESLLSFHSSCLFPCRRQHLYGSGLSMYQLG